MQILNDRAARAILAATLLALAACVDEPTSPNSMRRAEPQFGVGSIITVTSLSGGTDVGSLRWTLGQATGGEVIRFDPALAGKTITLDTTIVVWGKPFTLEGPANQGITISGGGSMRIFDLDPGAAGNETVLRNVTIANGNAGPAGSGAGILVRGLKSAWVRIENSTFTGNVAGSSPAIAGLSTLLVNTTVTGNTATSTTSDYPAVFSDNLTLVNSTIAHNTSAGVSGPNMIMRNSIISNNAGRNCTNLATLYTLEGGNIADDGTCGSVFDLTIADPMLGPLADNGGPTMTHALLAGSPGINTGSQCSVAVDQRYAPRDAQCDIGAFEFVDFTTVELTVASSATFDKNGWAVLTGYVKCSRNETFDLYVELHQLQKTGQKTNDVHAVSTTPINCTTNALPWSVSLVTTDAPFEIGNADATVATLNAKKWVTPASGSYSVKLFKGRK